jgi:hypothetical protein
MFEVIKIIEDITLEGDEQYFGDKSGTSNSDLKNYKKCPFYFEQKKLGNVIERLSDEMIFGTAVDCLLSGDSFEKRFFIGKAVKETPVEIIKKMKVIKDDIKARESDPKPKAPLKSQITDLLKLEEKLRVLKENEDKTILTADKVKHIQETYEEIVGQPLYKAFASANTQTIIALKLLVKIDGVEREIIVKGKLDGLDLENKLINDDKTTGNIKLFNPGYYYGQGAYYRWLVELKYNVTCDFYWTVADRNAKWKRSEFFYVTPETLDQAKAENENTLCKLLKAQDSNFFPPATDFEENARRDKCFDCDHYTLCPFSKQTEFTAV